MDEMKLYTVDYRALKYYKNIIQKRNVYNNINIDKDILIKRLTAMIYSGINIKCKNKENTNKVYCNGFKITIDTKLHHVKYLAIIGCSDDDFNNHNLSLLNASMSQDILNKLKENYIKLGLNELGLVNKNETIQECSIISDEDLQLNITQHIANDVLHMCESELITDPMIALSLVQSLYYVRHTRRVRKNIKDERVDITSKRVYKTRVLNKELGAEINW